MDEVGLRLLLCPIGSNIIVRTACCSAGFAFPVYSTFKAIETEDQNEQKKWLFYWTAYGSFSIAEIFTDKLISWFPLYYHIKFAFLVWLQLPSLDGAKQLYVTHLRPFLLKHQTRLDQVASFHNAIAYQSRPVGLRLLLRPIASNTAVVRTSCCSVGIVLPVYSTFKAIETEDQNEQKKWLFYWAAYGSFSIAEFFTNELISRFPLYYGIKFVFLVWLQLLSVDESNHLYVTLVRPFLLNHQSSLDQIVEFSYGEMGKIVRHHQTEVQFAKTLLVKTWISAHGMARDIFQHAQRRGSGAIEGPRTLLGSPDNNMIEGPETQVEENHE